MKIKLNEWQLKVAKDKHRFKVICAGRRSGKSVLLRLTLLKWAVEKSGVYWVVSPTYKQAKSIHWLEAKKEIPREWVQKLNETELSITLKNGSIIEFKGAENPDSLRGVKLRGLSVDEIASIRNWNWLWNEVLRATLTDYESPAIFISTPKGFNHFFELYEMGQRDGTEYRSCRFTSYDNPYVPASEIDKAKVELTEDTFEQEYMADFRKYTGLVYKEFDRGINVIESFDIPERWDIIRGIDFGHTNPTACLWIAVDNDNNFFVIDEHYETGRTIDHHAGVVNANPFTNRVSFSYGDPSGAQWFTEFRNKNIYITPATRESGQNINGWVRFGIEKVAEKLRPIPGRIVE
ncbi:phage terminase large subunit, partial [bacterium]|nr:phage terminase large subunit [bacterium]